MSFSSFSACHGHGRISYEFQLNKGAYIVNSIDWCEKDIIASISVVASVNPLLEEVVWRRETIPKIKQSLALPIIFPKASLDTLFARCGAGIKIKTEITSRRTTQTTK